MIQKQRKGVAIVICAPSGTGKTTLIKKLKAECSRFSFSISCTTRSPREGELDGLDYHFISKECFIKKRDAGFFAEWAKVHGHYYGTPLEETQKLLAQGRDVLFDIDVQGAAQIRHTVPYAQFIFIFPPSLSELERRLRKRQTEAESDLSRRLHAAKTEMKEAEWFDYWIVNDDLEQAWLDLRTAYLASTLMPRVQKDFLSSLFD